MEQACRGGAKAERVTRLVAKRGSAEITRLTEKNNELIEELKRLNSDLDTQVAHVNFSARPPPAKFNRDEEETKIVHEIECLVKMGMVYEKELESLRGKMKVKAGPDRVMELERALVTGKQKQEQMAKKIKQLQLDVKKTEKFFEKDHDSQESGTLAIEVALSLLHSARNKDCSRH